MNDTRMGLTIALTATQHGAAVANRVKVGRWESIPASAQGRLIGD
jgi:glycerol-3-phosphate dehydrogenase